MALKNPYRLWMTYLADWHLIERSHEDIRRIVADAHIAAANLVVDTDQTTLTLLVQVSKPGNLTTVRPEMTAGLKTTATLMAR